MGVRSLYYWPTPNAYKVQILLEELDLDYDLEIVDIRQGEQFEENFLREFPNNKIPVYVERKENGEEISLFESGAILEYLADTHGAFLAPAKSPQRYHVLKWLYWQMASLGPMLGQNFHFTHYADENIPYALNRYQQETERLYAVLDYELSHSPFVGSEHYSIADMAIYPWVYTHAKTNIQLQDFPAIQLWFFDLSERKAVKRSYEIGKQYREGPTVNEDSKKILFNQGSQAINKLRAKD